MKRSLLNSIALFWVMIFAVGILLSHAPAEATASAGYAILIRGSIPSDDEGDYPYYKTINRVFRTLYSAGFKYENIIIFDSKTEIQSAIEAWAANKMNSEPAPLYIVMVDHGDIDAFHIGNEDITPQELNGWLNTLENSLSNSALQEKRVVIIGACHSGSFIDDISKNGRIIITDGIVTQETRRGIEEPDGFRGGDFFIDELFSHLDKGFTLKKSFKLAVESTNIYTGYSQYPLLDDDGDGEGSNHLSDLYGDGFVAESICLNDCGTRWFPYNPSTITAVSGPVYLSPTQTTADLWARLSRKTDLDFVFAFHGNDMIYNPSLYRWEITLGGFIVPGKRYIDYFSFIFDYDAIPIPKISPMNYSIVYKDRDGNHAPNPFSLRWPADGSVQKPIMILNWESAVDPDGDDVTYTVKIALDSNGTKVIYQKSDITDTILFTGYKDINYSNGTFFYWKVEATDVYGRRTLSNVRTFRVDNTGEIPTTLEGYVRLLRPSSPSNVTFYPTIQEAYNNSVSGDIIQVPAVPLTGNLSFNRSVSVALEGGYNPDFATYSGGFTSLKGSITTYSGTVTMKNIMLEK